MSRSNKKAIQRNYDELGGRLYDLRYGDEQSRKYDAAFLFMLPKKDELFLDDGCGTGMFLSRFESIVVGVDLSSGLLKTALERLKDGHYLVLGDAELLPIRKSVFDGIFAMTLIQNTPNKTKALSEMRRVVKKNGRVLITVLKPVIDSLCLQNLIEVAGFSKVIFIGDVGTNDWIAYAES